MVGRLLSSGPNGTLLLGHFLGRVIMHVPDPSGLKNRVHPNFFPHKPKKKMEQIFAPPKAKLSICVFRQLRADEFRDNPLCDA